MSEDFSTCVGCPLSGLVSSESDCECANFAQLKNDGSCECRPGFVPSAGCNLKILTLMHVTFKF